MAAPGRRPAWPGELAVVAFLLVVYDWIANLGRPRAALAIGHAQALLAFEGRWHLAVERPLDRLAATHPRLGGGLALYYDLAHPVVTVAVLVAVFVLAPRVYRRCRRALVLVNLAALAVFLALPVAPPRLLPHAGFVDVVARSGTWSAWQGGSAVVRHANEFASMPSLHVAWAVWVLLAVRAASPRRGLHRLAGTHAALTVAVVLLTGNHYVLDVVAGALLAGTAWALAGSRSRTVMAHPWRRLPRPGPDRAVGPVEPAEARVCVSHRQAPTGPLGRDRDDRAVQPAAWGASPT